MSKKLTSICFLVFLIMQFVLPFNSFAQSENLAKNPGFEEGSSDSVHFWIFECWDKNEGVTKFSLDETQARTGTKSAFVVNNSANDSRYKQPIRVKGNKYYRISCWIKTENVGQQQKGANLSIEGSHDSSRDIKGTSTNWEYVELYGKASPNQESFTLTLGLGGYSSTNTGKAWFDDVEVVELDSLPPGKTAANLDPSWNSQNKQDDTSNFNFIIIGVSILLAAILCITFFIIFMGKDSKPKIGVNSIDTKSSLDFDENGLSLKSQRTKVRFDKKDLIIMSSMTFIYLLLALFNLGDLKVPTTSWLPSMPGESFTVDLGKDATLSRVYFYLGLGKGRDAYGKFRIEYLDPDPEKGYVHLASFEKKDIFSWKYVDTAPVKTRKLKFIVDRSGGTLNEIGIFESGSTKPLQGIKVVEKDVDENSVGIVENLFDEQNLVVFKPSYKNSMYFDEIYHARTAYEHINKMEPFETTHPPLGKVILSLGILVFGMVPFGWRIMGTLFGVAMIPAMYTFGKKVFHKRFYAFCSAFLMMFDFMHFSQTRIATIDSYVTLFIILMYYYMYDYYANKSYVLGFKASLKPLFLSGLFFGLGIASKWIALYGAAGLALLFFLTKVSEYNDYRKIIKRKPESSSWVYRFFPLYVNATTVYCVAVFVIIPLFIYFLSYIPWMQVPGPGHSSDLFYKNSLSMLDYHAKLRDTHPYQSPWWEWPIMGKPMAFYFGSDLEPNTASKIFTMGNPAIWWTGILAFAILTVFALKKVPKYYVTIFAVSTLAFSFIALPNALITTVFGANNLELSWIAICTGFIIGILALYKFEKKHILVSALSLVAFIVVVMIFHGVEKNVDFYTKWTTQSTIWLFLLACIAILFRGIYKYDRKLLLIMAAMIFQYVPWIAVPRIAFIYHYFSIVPFLILAIVYIIKTFVDKYPEGRYVAYIYLGLVFGLFVLFYPGLSGLEVPVNWMSNLKWFNTWYF